MITQRAENQSAPSPLRWIGKSAEVIDGKGVAMAPLCKRVWKFLEIKEIKRVEDMEERIVGAGGSVGRDGEKPFNIVSSDYDSVNTPISD
jgi:hypothetical protein